MASVRTGVTREGPHGRRHGTDRSARAAAGRGRGRDGGRRGIAAREPLHTPPGGGELPPAWEAAERIPLWDGAPPGGPFVARKDLDRRGPTFVTGVTMPDLHVFQPAKANGRALLVMPGGAYSFVSIRNEGVGVANVFAKLGYTVFVLTYRLPGEGWTPRADVPLQDAQRAMRLIRARAARYGVDPAKVAVLGFSAGGHLAASLLTGMTSASMRHATPRTGAARDRMPAGCSIR